MAAPNRRAANITLDAALIDEARALNLNLSRAAEAGVAEAVRKEKERRWRKENAEAIKSSNEYVEKYGLPLEHERLF